MIINQIANHVREIMMRLRTEYVDVPDILCGILDSYARYKTGGVMGLGVSIPVLTRRAPARYYRGLDEAQALEKNDQVDRHFAYYSDMSVPVVMVGTDMQRMTGLVSSILVRQDYSLGHMNKNDRLMLLNAFNTAYETAAAGAQARKVGGLHGDYITLDDDEIQRAPESLKELFDPAGKWHGLDPNELGSWDEAHVWSRDPVGNHPNNIGDNKYLHCPQVVDAYVDAHNRTLPSTATAGSTAGTNVLPYGQANSSDIDDEIEGSTTLIKYLDRILRQYNMVVKRKKLGYMDSHTFTDVVGEILNKNLNVPQLKMGGHGWEYDIDCVKIAGTTIIADPNAKEGTLRVLEVGDPGMDNGTVFPFYWDPLTSPVEEIRKKAKMKSDSMGRPKGLDFGYMRETPYFGDEWYRDTRYEDAVASKLRLAQIPIVCVLRGHQLELNRLHELVAAL